MSTHVPIRVLVVDDHTLFRRGVIALLEGDSRFAVVSEAGDASEAQSRALASQPDVILLDNHLPGVKGVDALAGLLEAAPKSRILMLTVSEDERDLAAALRGGARGYLLKTVDSEVMSAAIISVMAGESTISPEMTGKLVAAFQSMQNVSPSTPPQADLDPIHTLSRREGEILAQIAKGATNKEIARALEIAEATVKIHVQSILRKLNLTSRVQAAVYASSRLT